MCVCVCVLRGVVGGGYKNDRAGNATRKKRDSVLHTDLNPCCHGAESFEITHGNDDFSLFARAVEDYIRVKALLINEHVQYF